MHGCTTFDDHTADVGNVVISFAGTAYTPKCIKVTTQQPVEFSGSFVSHPLSQDCGPIPTILNTAGPYTFGQTGIYGFTCEVHGGLGMAGAIQVVAP